MWLVPPSPPSLVTHLYTLSLSRPGLSLWQVPPSHPPSSLSYPLYPFPLSPIGPACHCGRSRLDSSFPPRLPYFFPFPTSYTGTYRSIPSPSLPFWPGLSLWQVPPRASPSSLLSLSTLPSHLSHSSILATSSPLARLVIVAGPAPFFPFPALLSLFIPSDITLPLTLPFLLHSGPACHRGRPRHFLLPLYISLTSFPRLSSCIHLITGPLYFITTLQARLAIVVGPASPIYLPSSSYLPSPPFYTHLFPSFLPLRTLARLAIVVGPAHPSP